MESVLPWLERYSYVGLFALLWACSFVLPLSKTLVLVGAGALASQGSGDLSVYMAVGFAGLVSADFVYFLLGYLKGEKLLKAKWMARPKTLQRFEAAKRFFRCRGSEAVFSARFTPFLRALVFLAAGMSRMSPARFLAADALSASIVAPAAVLSGYLVSEAYESLAERASKVEVSLAAAFLLVLLVLLVSFRRDN